jgi:hypothetical protein
MRFLCSWQKQSHGVYSGVESEDTIMVRRFHGFPQAVAAAFGLLVLAAISSTPARAATCTRACLQHMITVYVDAMVAHTPGQMPVSADARFTEDSHELKLGEGLWKTVTAKGHFRQDYVDQKRQIVASHVELYEGETQVLYSVVLRITNRKISGIESIIFRVPTDPKSKPDHLDKPLPVMNDPVPAGKRMSREEMIKVALRYTEGLRIGSFAKADTPFAPEAYRYENGLKTAGEGCTTSSVCEPKIQKMMLHPDIKPSVAAVDEQAGIVLLWMNFGDTHSYGPGRALVTFEAFKIYDGSIHAINAFFGFLPKETERSWPSND